MAENISGFSDRVEFQLIINGKEFPFGRVNMLDSFHTSCSTRIAVPMMHLHIKDTTGTLEKKQDLQDGVPILVTFSVAGVRRQLQYRLHTYKDMLDGTGTTYLIDGYLDTVPYWLKSSTSMVRGTSNDALKQIADRCGITYQGTTTTDSQVWIQRNRKNRQFAADICRHGYANDSSCMQLGYDVTEGLIYADIAAQKESVANFYTARFDRDAYTVVDFQRKNKAGIMNALSGYADSIREQSIFSLVSDEVDEVKVNKLSQKLMLNREIYDEIRQGRVLFTPISSGNVHANYHRALYQNRRIAGMYAFGLELVINQPSKNVKLLDFINYEGKTKDDKVAPFSGTYIVTSRVLYIQGINYFEKFEVTRQGVNAAVESQI